MSIATAGTTRCTSDAVQEAEDFARICRTLLLEAEQTMPTTSVDWYGHASDLWRDWASRLRGRLAAAADQAQDLAQAIARV